MNGLEFCFWVLTALVVYAYLGYPLMLLALVRVRRPRVRACVSVPHAVTLVLAAHNEEAALGRRLEELSTLVSRSSERSEIIVVSDGSTDATLAVARQFASGIVRVLELPERRGKAAALNAGCALARNEVIVFADTRQTWAPDALARLLENFSDPEVGAVSGELMIESAPGVRGGVGLYWRYEKWLRRLEGEVGSVIGVTGAISAVRRELFRTIPPGTLLDDVYWPLRVALGGRRVVFEPRACAFDRLPSHARDEFRRKVRTLTGNWQLMSLLPEALRPGWELLWWQFLSHKILRLMVPWALIGLLLLSAALPEYELLLGAQAAFYLLALAGLCIPAAGRFRPAAAAGAFLLLNSAAWLAGWNWLAGRTAQAWGKVGYEGRTVEAFSLTSGTH